MSVVYSQAMAHPQADEAVGTTSQFWRLAFTLFAVALSSQAASPVLLFYTHDLALTPTMLTVFFAIYALGLVPALLLGGPQSDRIGRKQVVVPAVVLVLLSVVAFEAAAAFGEPALLLARFLQGITAGAVFTVGTVWLRELAGTAHATRAAMVASGVMAFGFAFGPLVTGALVEWAPYPKIVPMLVPLVLLALAITLLLSIPETMTRRQEGRIRVGVPASARRGFFLFLLPVGLLVYTPAMLTLTIFPIQAARAGASSIYALTGVSIFCLQGAAALAAIYARKWGARVSGWLSAVVCIGGCLLGYVAVQPGGAGWLLPASALIGFSGGLAMTAGLMVSDLLAPIDRRGGLVSMFYIVVYFGFMVPTIFATLFGKQTLEKGSTILAHAAGALIVLVIVAGPGQALLRRREAEPPQS